ncbi:MAG: nitrogen fixation protein NifM [Zoogloeaceae bacterium]|jgi:nitrogen fixation protein NifM|nr:nitrogen fixation protein NifM [Zoogloeaceae bacterium]
MTMDKVDRHTDASPAAHPAVHPYLRLKVALELFQKTPEALSQQEALRVGQVVERQARIEAALLNSPEALRIVIPDTTRAARLAEIRKRYADRAEFLADIERNGLSEATLEAAIARDLVIEAALERVAAMTPEITETEAETYYHRHPHAFTRPETRRLRHILITFSGAGERQEALALLESLRRKIGNLQDFAAAALRHSQCPSALEEGVIGTVRPGQLYPELEAHAFALAEGEISAPLESPMGLHLLYCETIHPAVTMSFTASKPQILARLNEARRKQSQQRWIKQLFRE